MHRAPKGGGPLSLAPSASLTLTSPAPGQRRMETDFHQRGRVLPHHGCHLVEEPIPADLGPPLIASALRDHEHDGHDGNRDAGHGEHPDCAEPQRHVATGSQRTLQLALTLCADD